MLGGCCTPLPDELGTIEADSDVVDASSISDGIVPAGNTEKT